MGVDARLFQKKRAVLTRGVGDNLYSLPAAVIPPAHASYPIMTEYDVALPLSVTLLILAFSAQIKREGGREGDELHSPRQARAFPLP